MRLVQRSVVFLALASAAFTAAPAGVLLQPEEAPEWVVSEWINGDPGPLSNQRGRVVVIEFFQLWCPGCNEFSIPLMNAWHEKWADRNDVLVVSIHTVFEGHDVQTPARLRGFVREKQMRHPVGIDKYPPAGADTPITMNRYKTGGTPHVAIIDQDGDLRFSHFGRFDPYVVEAFIDRLIKERDGGIRPPPPKPADKPGGRPNRAAQADASRVEAAKASRVRGRPASDGATVKTTDPPGKPLEPAGDEASNLSGSYQMQFQQQLKSCGTKLGPQNVPVDITVNSNRLVARFRQRFLGLNQVAAEFAPDTGEVSSESMRRTDEDGVGINLKLQIDGKVDMGANPPTIRFQFALEKEGDDPGWECEISGTGSATRTSE